MSTDHPTKSDLANWLRDELEEYAPPEFISHLADPDTEVVSFSTEANSDPIYSWGSAMAVGYEQEHVYEVELRLPSGMTSTHRFSAGTSVVFFDEDDEDDRPPEILIGIEDVDGDNECEGCGEPFDEDTWEYDHGYGDRSGSSTYYNCPDGECDGTAVILV